MAVRMVCDKCENDVWYIVGSKPTEDIPPYLIQVCSRCGFAVKELCIGVKCLLGEVVTKELEKGKRLRPIAVGYWVVNQQLL